MSALRPSPRAARPAAPSACSVETLEGRVLLATVPAGFRDSVYASGIAGGTAMAFAPDGRLFVARQAGPLRVVTRGAGGTPTLQPTPFLTVTTDFTGERGLLGVAFDPAFMTNGRVYVYYTVIDGSTRYNRVSYFEAEDAEPDPSVYRPGNTARPGSEVPILRLENLGATNHNGGAIHFGPDGKLYVAVGENANRENARTLNNRLGKMLRINADGSIPSDNPFYNTATGDNRAIWALGLRNPYTFAFQPGTGRMLINDVGEGTWEEINNGAAGANYGWPTIEGYRTSQAAPAIGTYVDPLLAYDHSANGGIAITGGAFYNPPVGNFPPEYVGKYFYSDYGRPWIRYVDPSTNRPTVNAFAAGIANPVDLQVGPDGALYYLYRGNGGGVGRITYAAPRIESQPASATVDEGAPVTFTVGAAGDAPLTYQWRRDGQTIPGATGASYTLPSATAADSGARFSVVVTNAAGTATSADATLTVAPPAPVLVGRYVFYNNSAFDGRDPAADARDDAAIAPDKQALLPGQRATFSNLTSYSRGINGVMVDVNGLPAAATITGANFAFQTGRGDGTWAAVGAPATVSVRPGAGASGSARVTITWADGVIANRWLRVTFTPNPAAASPINQDVFYFGNLRGDTGDVSGPDGVRFSVGAFDTLRTRRAIPARTAPIDNPFDHNRDGRITTLDRAITQRNRSRSVLLFTAAPPPLAPAASDEDLLSEG
jgi:glucose/arabinose dehydrogenase